MRNGCRCWWPSQKRLCRLLNRAALQNGDRLLHQWIVRRSGLPWRGSGDLLWIVQGRQIFRSRRNRRNHAIIRNRFSGRSVIIRHGENQSRAVIELNHFLSGSCSESAVANGFTAMIVAERTSENFRGAGRAAGNDHDYRLFPNKFRWVRRESMRRHSLAFESGDTAGLQEELRCGDAVLGESNRAIAHVDDQLCYSL